MPLQNRVTPTGEIIATSARGLLMGNRGGRLHDENKRLGSRRWAGKAWICCLTSFKERRREVMGTSYTELFFLDEATALAAGHRPCFECRRSDAIRFAELWNGVRGLPGRARAARMDAILHRQRLAGSGAKGWHREQIARLPGGTIVVHAGTTGLWNRGRFWPWTPEGYQGPASVNAHVDVLTPPAIVAVLAAGYHPVLHGSGIG